MQEAFAGPIMSPYGMLKTCIFLQDCDKILLIVLTLMYSHCVSFVFCFALEHSIQQLKVTEIQANSKEYF